MAHRDERTVQKALTGFARWVLTLLAVASAAGAAGFGIGFWLGG
jgi:hypothetical protein